MDEQIEDEISHDDNTPSILEQAHKEGWNAAYYNFGKAEGGRDWFNPAIIQRGEELWMLVRGSEPHPQGFRFGQNFIWAFEMDESGKTPKRGIKLHWKVDNPEQHFEDPRGFYNPNIGQTIIGACTFIWYPDGRWTGAHQCIGSFDDDWQCSKMDYPKIGGSPGALDMLFDKKKYEKNWLPFLHDNSLHILYKAKPWHIVGYGQTWSDLKNYESEGVSWAHGDVRGGTSPVKVGDMYFTFPHSSLPWRSRYRRYYAGAMAFDANPPFTPRLITPEPILRGSQNDPWAQKKPLVVFPCGAIYKDGTWLVTCGVNDMKAAWIEIPHEDILKRMVPIGESGASVFPITGLSDSEVEARKKLLSGAGVAASQDKLDNGLAGAESATISPVNVTVPTDVYPPAQKLSGAAAVESHLHDVAGKPAQAVRGPTSVNPSRLEKLRANAAKARVAKAAKRNGGDATVGEGTVPLTPSAPTFKPKARRIKRCKRRTKAQMAAARLQALREFESKKTLANAEIKS